LLLDPSAPACEVILPTDIPTRAEIDRLLEYRGPLSVSIYLPTDPASSGDPERIELKTLGAQALSQLREAGAGAKVVRRSKRRSATSTTTRNFGATRPGSWPSSVRQSG
jgi:hypothetical protein